MQQPNHICKAKFTSLYSLYIIILCKSPDHHCYYQAYRLSATDLCAALATAHGRDKWQCGRTPERGTETTAAMVSRGEPWTWPRHRPPGLHCPLHSHRRARHSAANMLVLAPSIMEVWAPGPGDGYWVCKQLSNSAR